MRKGEVVEFRCFVCGGPCFYTSPKDILLNAKTFHHRNEFNFVCSDECLATRAAEIQAMDLRLAETGADQYPVDLTRTSVRTAKAGLPTLGKR